MLAQESRPPQSTPAPWRESFLGHVNSMTQATFVLSTLHPVPASETATPSPSHLPVVPRARTCVCRGLWGSLPTNDKNPAPRNPPAWESDLPVLTTDARMDKAAEVVDTAGHAGLAASGRATGGGGPVEAVWWAESSSTQWRIRGTAWLLGPDVEADECRQTREMILGRMRKRAAGEGPGEGPGAGAAEWSWKTELTAHFGNLSPMMRGSFKSPIPGSPIVTPPEEGLGLGQKVEDLEDGVARSNFRVVVIVPSEVDQVDLSDQLRPRRWLYIHRGSSPRSSLPGGEIIGEWEKAELWP